MTARRGQVRTAVEWALSEVTDPLRRWWRVLAEQSVDEICRALLQPEAGGNRLHRARRSRVLVVLAEVIRERLARSGSVRVMPRIISVLAAASTYRRSDLARAVACAHCTNDPVAKSAEVAHAVEALCTAETRERVIELYRRGALRHEYDVAYAVIMVGHFGETVDRVAAELDQDYVQLGHRCSRVYPPS